MCDHVNKEYQPKFGNYSNMFFDLFPHFEWKYYDVYSGIFPQNLSECDVYFATGSKHSVYEDIDWINELKDVVRQLYHENRYFIGFCFGHQLMADALGGKVGKSPNGWCVGVHDFDIKKREDWMHSYQDHLGLLMMCQDQVLTLPHGSTVLAKNEACPVAIMAVGDTFLGIQAHPEFSKSYDKLLIQKRISKMGKDVAKKGILSLDRPIHNGLLQNWITKFLTTKM